MGRPEAADQHGTQIRPPWSGPGPAGVAMLSVAPAWLVGALIVWLHPPGATEVPGIFFLIVCVVFAGQRDIDRQADLRRAL